MSEFVTCHFYFREHGFYAECEEETRKDGLPAELSTDRYHAMYNFGFLRCPEDIDAVGRFLFTVAGSFVDILLAQPDLELLREKLEIHADEDLKKRLLAQVPFVDGSEFVNAEWIDEVTEKLLACYSAEIKKYKGSVALYLAEKNQDLTVPERVFFHLVETPKEEYPFAFLATYATKLKNGKVKHVPLKYALTEYQYSNAKLLELLACLNRVAEVSPLVAQFVESGEMFHPLGLNETEAFELLKDVPAIEGAGVIFRVPNWWRRNAVNPSLTMRLGEDKPVYLGLDTIIGIRPTLMLDGVELSVEDIQRLLGETEGLSIVKGKWIVVNHDQLRRMLEELQSSNGTMTLLDAIRMAGEASNPRVLTDIGTVVTNGEWLQGLLSKVKNPEKLRKTAPPTTVKATLRPYQQAGYEWLRYMDKLKFGACLADDMGLGKTLQVLTYLESVRRKDKNARILLVVPASLLGNWSKEAEHFVPSMPLVILHGIGNEAILKALANPEKLPFLTITTYGMIARTEEFAQVHWNTVILDEAQAIKNPGTKQTRAVKKLPSQFRIAMTGTPIENELANLWSLFDFLNKGLLGSANEFSEFTKSLQTDATGYSRLKNMISPFMLRRLKTDKRIISDLPDKVENVDYVALSRKQMVLYRKYVADVEEKVRNSEGIERRGIVLGAITKLKQICNHPDEYLGQETYAVRDSGKFEMMREICETIRSKRERVLVFTQFREVTPYLDDFLAEIFGRRGFVLHGGTPVKQRSKMVEQFQSEKYVPYMVISVKAGGTGLNLTNANHVIHFDRWWNPAVENQATDRAFRIGQDKKVMVHKLVCRGTIEEKIDAMINDKTSLANNVIGATGENWITKMSDDELMEVLRLG